MRRRRHALLVLCAVIPALAGCGAQVRESLRPGALPPLTTSATATEAGVRLAMAPLRYRTQIFAQGFRYANDPVFATVPDVVSGAPSDLKVSVYTAGGDNLAARPLIVWIHGGAFLTGNRFEMESTAVAYARLGYVTASIDYRIDPGNHCVQVQAGVYSGATLVAERARCEKVILAARDDAAAAVAFLRANAATYRIDTSKVVVGGASAGAITAVHVGQTLNVPGSPPPAESRVSAVLAMSGCNYIDGSIDAADAPIAMLASGFDALVPFTCASNTVAAAEALGTPVWRNFFPAENGHAQALYAAHQDEVDRGWRLFLIDQLGLA
jgi:acetyl esterase/lipase